jgi:hypothetical protein
MCKKTVINRATKVLIGSSDDSEVVEEDNKPVKARNESIKDKAGKKELNVQDTTYEEVKDDAKPAGETKPETTTAEAQANEHSGSKSAKVPDGPGY